MNAREFDKILDSILSEIEKNPSSDIDKLIVAQMEKMGLSKNGKKLLDETNSYLETYEKVYAKLQQAKESGETRTVWLQKALLEIAKTHKLNDEQTEQLIADFADESENELEKTQKEGE